MNEFWILTYILGGILIGYAIREIIEIRKIPIKEAKKE